jgi:ABC-type uncharacterized transport system permease subunit
MIETNAITVGAAIVALGVGLLLASLPFKGNTLGIGLVISGVAFGLVGLFICVVAFLSIWQKQKREAIKENWDIDGKVLLMDVLAGILCELKGLRQDLKGGEGRDGGHKNS